MLIHPGQTNGEGGLGLTPEQEQLLEKASFANIDDVENGAVFEQGDSFRSGYDAYIVKPGQVWTKGTDLVEEGTKLDKKIIQTDHIQNADGDTGVFTDSNIVLVKTNGVERTKVLDDGTLRILENGESTSGNINISIVQGIDDASESGGGVALLANFTDIQSRPDAGFRFQNVTIPNGATISSAYFELQARNDKLGDTNITLTVEDIDNSPVFTIATSNITARTSTSNSIVWVLGDVLTDVRYQSPDISSVINEVVNRAGWNEGNSLSILLHYNSGASKDILNYESSPSNATRIVVEYTTSSGTSRIDVIHDGLNAKLKTNLGKFDVETIDASTLPIQGLKNATESINVFAYAGSPEGVITASKGSQVTDTTNGVFYVKTTDGVNTGWVSTARGLDDVVEDITPQLGGDLDTNNKSIVNASGDVKVDDNLHITGDLTVDGVLPESKVTKLFANFDARFFAEKGLPDLQGWAVTQGGNATMTVVSDNIFSEVKDSIKFVAGGDPVSAKFDISGEDWDDVLLDGFSYSFIVRFTIESGNSLFSGMGFDSANDPRTASSIQSRAGVFVGAGGTFTNVELIGSSSHTLDGLGGRPLVLKNEFFKVEVVLDPTPDTKVNFGALNLYVNNILIDTGAVQSTSSTSVNNKISMQNRASSGTTEFYIGDFGVTGYKESPIKLLNGAEMPKGEITVVEPGGKRDYEIIIPDGFPRKIGNSIKIIANNVTGTVTLRAENLSTPQALFNGLNSLDIYIDAQKEVLFTNLVDDGNIYQGTIPHKEPFLDTKNIEIYENGQLELLATSGVITISEDNTYTFKNQITTSVEFNVIAGATLVIQGIGLYPLLWAGVGTFLTSTLGHMHIRNIRAIATNLGTLLDLTGNPSTNVVFNGCVFNGWKMGSVYNISTSKEAPQFYFEHTGFYNWKQGLICTNATEMAITDCTIIQIDEVSANQPFITLYGSATVGLYAAGTTGSIEAGESFLRIDPEISNTSRIQIASQSLSGNYFEMDGTQGTFTAVADASIALTTIDSVSDNIGIARFNYTGAPLFVDQEIVISGFVINTAYNGTYMIITVDTTWFEVTVAFGSDEASGSFTANSITLTDTGTSLTDGDTLTIESQNVLAYDGGAIVYNKLINSFQISRTFTITDAGTWNTSGIDQVDRRVLASNNPSQPSSKYIGAGYMNGNADSNTDGGKPIISQTYTDIVLGGVGISKASNMERWKVIDPIFCILEYTGNEPFSGFIDYNLSSFSSGGTDEFRYKWVVDNGSGYQDLADNKYSKSNIGATPVNTSDRVPLAVFQGDRVKPQLTRETISASPHTTEDFSFSITAS